VNIPSAAAIGNVAFGYTGGTALTVTLGVAVPALGTSLFTNVETAKSVTLRIPSGANGGYGGAWNGTAAIKDGFVNDYIENHDTIKV
jgi:hypothetical protein